MVIGVLFALAAGMMWGLVFIGTIIVPEYPAALQSTARYLAFGLISLPLAGLVRPQPATASNARRLAGNTETDGYWQPDILLLPGQRHSTYWCPVFNHDYWYITVNHLHGGQPVLWPRRRVPILAKVNSCAVGNCAGAGVGQYCLVKGEPGSG